MGTVTIRCPEFKKVFRIAVGFEAIGLAWRELQTANWQLKIFPLPICNL
jgi:hypothetical protein